MVQNSLFSQIMTHLETAQLGALEQRWVAQLANFRYPVKYSPGTQNKNTLSKLPEQKQEMAPMHADQVMAE